MQKRQRLTPDFRRSGGFVGIGGLACVLFVILASVTTFSWWGATLLVVLWVLLLVVATRWFTPHPVWVMALPVVGFLAWLGAVAIVAQG